MSHKSQTSQASPALQVEEAIGDNQVTHDGQRATDYHLSDSNEISDDDNLAYDWETSEILQIVKAFPISDYGTKSDDLTSSNFLVPEPPSLSGIIDSSTSKSSSSKTTDVEGKYLEDDMSSLSDVSAIKVSNAPRKHEYGKEKAESEGNMYNKLYNACLKGQLSVAKNILENYNTTRALDKYGQTALYAACIGDHPEIASLLIESGYNVNHQDVEGKTPVHVAFENHALDLARALITQFCANTEVRDLQNWTPLHTAIDRGYYNYAQELLQKLLCQDVGTEVSWIQLHAACFEENIQDVQFLLEAHTDVNHASSAMHTPLHIAVTKSNIILVTLLLDQNVDINCMTVDRLTPLHIAVDKGDEAIIQKLLSQKADPNLKDALGNISLHLAVQLKRETKPRLIKGGTSNRNASAESYQSLSLQTVQAIIEHGANVNAMNNRGQTPLWFACYDGQINLVKILLEAGADPTKTDNNSDSSLHSVMYGCCSAECAQKVIDHGAHVNAANKDGATPFLIACSKAQAELVKLLLKAKADPNITDTDGDTSLHAAIAADCSEEIIQEIIDHGAEINAVNKRGRTALLLSCFYRQMDSVKVLLEVGADPTISDEEGFSCLQAAVDGRCSKNTLQALMENGAQIDAKRKDGTNALLRACRTGQSESVLFLLEAGVDVNIVNFDGNTSLHVAVYGNCNKQTLQQMIEKGVSVNALNKRGETALVLACELAQVELVRVLLEKGANPDISDHEGYTRLHAAVFGHCPNETLQEIIAHKAYLHAKSTKGVTALFLACTRRQQEAVKILLTAGSNPNTSTIAGTSLHAAIFGGCSKKIISSLIGHGADVNAVNKKNASALFIACCKGDEDAINVLLKAGADANNAEVGAGNTCLHHAVSNSCSKETLQAIIDRGARVNATNKHNDTALNYACHKGNTDAIDVLLKAGANVNNTEVVHGNTCIHDAIIGSCSKETLQAIIDCGACVNATNKYNDTALNIACHKGKTDAIDVFLKAGANVNSADVVHGNTCIHHAIMGSCSKETLQAIIDHGASVNAANRNNNTALNFACIEKNTDAINVLLKKQELL